MVFLFVIEVDIVNFNECIIFSSVNYDKGFYVFVEVYEVGYFLLIICVLVLICYLVLYSFVNVYLM